MRSTSPLGIGAIIGTGIFVIIGEAIALCGPGIVVSFLLAGVTCVFSALAYAEPDTGSVDASSAGTCFSSTALRIHVRVRDDG